MTKVVIVGAGVVGAAIAYSLSKVDGLSITLVEQNHPAAGSTGAALGVLMGIISQKTKGRAWQLREKSIKAYPNLLAELTSLTNINIPSNNLGVVSLCFEGEDLSKWETLKTKRAMMGWPLEIWSKSQLLEKCPQIQCPDLFGAIYSPKDLQINPKSLTTALVKGAEIGLVKCLFGVEVKSININGDKCSYVETSQGNLECDYLIMCAGIGSSALTADLGKSLDIRPVLGQAIELKLEKNLGREDFEPVITGDDVHIVPLGHGGYWVGATVEFQTETGEFLADSQLLEQVKHKAYDFCPALAKGKIISTWSGKRPRPQNEAAPIIKVLEGYSNIIVATGHYRNGVLLAPATADQVKEILLSLVK